MCRASATRGVAVALISIGSRLDPVSMTKSTSAPAAAPAAASPSGRGAQGPPAQTAAEWEKEHAATLDNAALRKGLKLLWFGTGKDDFLLTTTQATVELMKKHGFAPVFRETDGAHTWINWRDYLSEFAPKLFQ